MARTLVFVLLVLALALHCVSGNMVCLYCSMAVTSTTCERTKTCGPHEICYSDAYVTPDGNLYYELGCRDPLQCSGFKRRDLSISAEGRSTDNTEVCSECCRGDLCNSGMCGQTGFLPVGSRGPICFTCDQQLHPGSCNVISQCSRDEVCAFIPAVGTSPSKTRCMASQECYNKHQGAMVIFGRRRRSDDGCHVLECCDQDVCNNYCNQYTTPVTTSITATTTRATPAPTTKPTTPTIRTSPHMLQTIKAGTCDHGWTGYGASCYFFSGPYNYIFKDAKARCEAQGGYLAEISGPQEDQFLKQMVEQKYSYYTDFLWIGLEYKNVNGRWNWVWLHSNTVASYTNFNYQHPNNPGNCGALEKTIDGWRSIPAVSTGAHYICEKDV